MEEKKKRKQKIYPSSVKARMKYAAANVTQLNIKLNKNTDSDVIAFLEKIENKNGYIKELIRQEIKKEK